MKKQAQRTTKQSASPLALRKETLQRLGTPELTEVIGAGRLRVPVGFADDTTPIYDDIG